MYYDNVALPGGDYADLMVAEEANIDGYRYDDFIGTQINVSLKAQGVRAPWYCISHDAHGHFSTRASRNVPAATAIYSDATYPVPVVAKALYTLGEDDAAVGCVICRGDGINSVVAIRHSCEPNMHFVHGRTLTFEASRPISKGEELTVDYSTLRDPKMPAFACSCGTASCRSVIFSDAPTARVSHQRRKWERRERLLAAAGGVKGRRGSLKKAQKAALAAAAAASGEADAFFAEVSDEIPSAANVSASNSNGNGKRRPTNAAQRSAHSAAAAVDASVSVDLSSVSAEADGVAAVISDANLMETLADSIADLELLSEEQLTSSVAVARNRAHVAAIAAASAVESTSTTPRQ